MTDKTFTDEEIVKALEVESVPSEMNCVYGEYREACGIYCTKKKQTAEYCHDCQEHKMDYRGRRAKSTLALINRQKAEIERLTVNMNAFALGMKAEKELADGIVDAFAEKVKPLFTRIVELMFDGSEPTCQVENCKKPDSIGCGDRICIDENISFWKAKVEEMAEEMKKPTEEKPFYSPEDISKMAPKQIRENYSAIMDSIKEW